MKKLKIVVLVLVVFFLVGCGITSMNGNENSNNGGNGNSGNTISGEVTKENYMNFPTTPESEFSVDYVDGGVLIHGCRSKDKVIKVPETINGQTVIGVGGYAFGNMEGLEAVVLPDTVETIGESAFGVNHDLKYVYLGKSLKSVEKLAFNYERSLVEINLPEGTQSIEKMVAASNKLERIYIPASVTEIKGYIAFECNNVTIYTPAGSYADKVAREAGLNVVNE